MIGKSFLRVIVILTTLNINDAAIVRKSYPFDVDIDQLEAIDALEMEITFLDSNAEKSMMEIVADEFIHHCCIQVHGQSDLKLFYTQLVGQAQYPPVVAYLHLRKPPSFIILRQQAKLTIKGPMKTDNFRIELYDNSYAQINVEISSNLNVHVQNTARLVISGVVSGTANIVVRNGGEFNARSCSINTVTVEVNEYGVAYVSGEESIHAITRQFGRLHSRTYEGDEGFSFVKELGEWFGISNTATKSTHRSTSFFFLFVLISVFNQIVFL